uniref:Autophagy related 2B n=1 Tax=Oreochromis niloticus TaxID=8128 RepID=I3KWB8_ORENI
MPWPFSESIKKRACRYLLHRYLGNFLQEKLSLDQLSLDLYQGTGSLAQVPLDTWSLNELLETADAPFEVITGFIQTISLTVPWAALLQENCALEIKGLEMVLRPRPRVASGVEPMYWSSFMTSSMQLAKECLSQKLTDDMGESFQPFEGLEKFAETIETVLRRVKVTFLDSVFRVEHIPENSKTGIALEIRINKIVYCDETGEESSSVNVHQPTTFAHKNVQMEGITVFWDEFSDVSRAACKSSPTQSVSYVQSKDLCCFQDQFPLCVHVHGCSWTLFAVCVSAHSSKTHSDESRPELVLRLTLGSLAVSVLHIDPLPPPHAAPSPLGPMAAHFFSMVGPGQLEPAAFLQSRTVFNQACPHDHLRFVGQGLKLNYDHWQGSNLRTFSTDITLNQMEFLECLFTSEAVIGGSQKGIQYTEVRPTSLSFVHLSLHNALDAFTEVFLDDSHTPANCHVSLTINAPVLGIAVHFPIPDLRSDQERGPWFKKSLQKETLHLELEELELKTEFMGGNSPDQTKMELTFKELTGVSRFQTEFLVAVGVRGATLQHRVVPPSLGWYDQIVDFLNVSDEPVLGYAPPTSVTTLHLHLWSCSLDYRPLYLPLRSLLVVETFSISSIKYVVSRIILDEAALFLSDKSNAVSVNLARDYVQVVDMGTLELRITAVKPGLDGKLSEPRFELRCSSDVIHIRTCSDSCAALMNLIQYVASYGDLLPPAEPETKHSSTTQKSKSLLYEFHTTAGTPEEQIQDHDPPRSDLFLFPDESGNCQDSSPPYPMLPSPLITPAPNLAQETDDFCILETPSSRGEDRDQEPVVKQLSSEPVEIKDDHFSQPMDGSDSSRGANFPIPEVRYLIREISVIWHLYGGKDFGSVTSIVSPARSRGSTPHSSPSQTPVRQAKASGWVGGGKGRNPDVRFQHEVYPQISAVSRPAVDQPVSRQVFSVQDLEIRDRLATSQMNKFLYLYSSKEMPRKAHSNMLTVKAMHMCPESGQAPPECCLRVTLMPLRLNIDQDALFFLRDFFTSLAAEVEFFSPPIQEVCVTTKKVAAPEISCSFSKHAGGSQDPAPIISVPAQRRLSQNGFSTSDQPIFFRLEFRFTSEVPIRLDYHGKHVSMDQGTFAGIIFGLTQLNCSELKLRQLCYRQGLLGVDKLFSYAINEWLNDIKTNQLQGLLSGVAPIHTLVKLVHGLRDLVWLPIEQYRKDGRIVRGFQRGTASFGTSTAMAALELTNRMVRTIQAAAETAYDMVSPVPDERDTKRVKRISHYGLAHQPVDLREGVAKAYTVVKEGITDTALTIYDTATREHEQRGMTGAVGGVLRQLPPAVVKPLIMATEATSNVLGGMRNQIHPDARQEESQKWRQGDE